MAEGRYLSIFMEDGSLWELPFIDLADGYADYFLKNEVGLMDEQLKSVKNGSDLDLKGTWDYEKSRFLNLEELDDEVTIYFKTLKWVDIKSIIKCVKKPDPNKLKVTKEWVMSHFPRDEMTIGGLKGVFNEFDRYIDKYASEYIKKFDYNIAWKSATFDLVIDN